MRKIPTVFKRDPEDMRHVLPEVTPGCEWVLAGEGTPTQKYDGTCVMLDDDGRWWARREVKPGKHPPAHFRELEHDETTGKTVGWEPIEQSPFVKFHTEALENWSEKPRLLLLHELHPGTYELCGPKINKNPQGYEKHLLISHARAAPVLLPRPRDFESLREALISSAFDGIEGVVWHHEDGRMAKLKVRDFA